MGLFLLALLVAFALGGFAAAWRFVGAVVALVLGCAGVLLALAVLL